MQHPIHTCAGACSRNTGSYPHTFGKVTHKDNDTGSESQAHSYSSQDSLYQQKLPPLRAEACHHDRHDQYTTATIEAETKVAFVEEWTDDDTHEEQKEDLEGADPSDLGGRVGRKHDILIVCLEDSIGLSKVRLHPEELQSTYHVQSSGVEVSIHSQVGF